ncbi:response regulator [Nitrincola iocasae]|uniref:Response regulator n=1 Tax=Nitrincola iocasae TaxID=2614693 RepID=A0A5J6LEJ2_9GAMM|nr:response regulator [Nitrincola iocasae]QEW06947.1 response regulator [Nitrincola iocasae]
MSQPIPVVICDDSQLARNQMGRALKHWNVDITFAEHGLKALEAIRLGKGHLLFLDLTMPIMDGYEVLERIRRDDLPSLTVVVSGDVQQSAKKRVLALGAMGFIAKPINAELLAESLKDYGLIDELEPRDSDAPADAPLRIPDSLTDSVQEVANIAMGRTASQLADVLQRFIHLPVPRVDRITAQDLAIALKTASGDQPATTVCQGFCGPGIAGEALLIFQDSSIIDLANLLHYQGELTETTERAVLMDIANVLTGAFLSNVSKLLDLSLSRGTPRILGLHSESLGFEHSPAAAQQLLCIEIDYQIAESTTHCDLLMLFTEDSLPALTERLELLK